MCVMCVTYLLARCHVLDDQFAKIRAIIQATVFFLMCYVINIISNWF